jgi:hypothetical protein
MNSDRCHNDTTGKTPAVVSENTQDVQSSA